MLIAVPRLEWKAYSFSRNLKYMGMAYTQPKSLLEQFMAERSMLCGLVPLFIFIFLFEIECILCHLYQWPSPNIFPLVLPIPEAQYQLYELFFGPFINLGSFLIFYIFFFITAKFLRIQKESIVKSTFFFMFIWNTIALLAVPLDLFNASSLGRLEFLGYYHPLALIIDIMYVILFLSYEAEISKRRAFSSIFPALFLFLTFRSLFLR